MTRSNPMLWIASAVVSAGLIGCGGAPADMPEEAAAPAEAPPAAAAPAAMPETPAAESAPAERPRFVAPIRGEAEVGYLQPDVKVQGNEVVTTIRLKNLSNGAIAGLRIEEFWWDSNNNPLPADSQRLREPLLPQGVAEIVLHTPKSADMKRNSYKFSHANGTIKTQLMDSIEEEAAEGEPSAQ